MNNNDNSIIDIDRLGTKIVCLAKKELAKYYSIYDNGFELCDLVNELWIFYIKKIEPKLENLKELAISNGHKVETYIENQLSMQINNIRRNNSNIKHRFITESQILDGRFESNRYFELLEGAGKLHLWNDNEIIIDTKEKKVKTFNNQANWEKEEGKYLSIEANEIWETLKTKLSERDFEIVVSIIIDGKTEREVASNIGISQQAVNKVMMRLKKFKESFKDWI